MVRSKNKTKLKSEETLFTLSSKLHVAILLLSLSSLSFKPSSSKRVKIHPIFRQKNKKLNRNLKRRKAIDRDESSIDNPYYINKYYLVRIDYEKLKEIVQAVVHLYFSPPLRNPCSITCLIPNRFA
jgi:hypothetical protein